MRTTISAYLLVLLCGMFSLANTAIAQDEGLIPRTPLDQIYENPPSAPFFYPKHNHKRSWHWNIYSVKAPMAWEITSHSSQP
jgi:hypothetical protein